MVWARRQDQWKGKNYSLPFSEKAEKMSRVVLHCVFGRDFLSLHTTIVLGVEDSSIAPACLLVLRIWHSVTYILLRPLRSGV